MPRKSIFDTHAVRRTVDQRLLRDSIDFLSTHSQVVLPASAAKGLVHVRQHTRTHTDTLYDALIQHGADKIFAFVKFTPDVRVDDVPEGLSFSHVTMDTKQLAPISAPLYQASLATAVANKIVLNVTPMVRREDDTVTNITDFQCTVIRDILSRSYYDSDRSWLAPTQILKICRVYTMSTAAPLSAQWALDIPEQNMLVISFAYYFLQMIYPLDVAEQTLESQSGELRLGPAENVRNVVGALKGALQRMSVTLNGADSQQISFIQICEAIKALGIRRIVSDVYTTAIQKFRYAGPNIHTSATALEYPPYFVYLLVMIAAGTVKIGLKQTLTNLRLIDVAKDVTQDLARSPAFLGSL